MYVPVAHCWLRMCNSVFRCIPLLLRSPHVWRACASRRKQALQLLSSHNSHHARHLQWAIEQRDDLVDMLGPDGVSPRQVRSCNEHVDLNEHVSCTNACTAPRTLDLLMPTSLQAFGNTWHARLTDL